MCQRRISYFYNDNIASYNYGSEHPMKPKRIALAHELIVGYGIYKDLNVYKPHLATSEEMNLFHEQDYIKYLESASRKFSTTNVDLMPQELQKLLSDQKKKQTFKIGETSDCPSFSGLFEFCQLSVGGSWDSAILLAENQADICINWAGGLHHAKKQEASGFCYVNDIVICILVLLRYFQRVLYIDIDVHHGDGVEEAFFTTNRVMTVSFHQYGEDFFPGSGKLESIGEGLGKYHSINVPLKPGMTDETYLPMFKRIINKVIEHFAPNAIVLQCGADSIVLDKLGNFNLSTKGHGECIDFICGLGIPTMLIGGGGYTIENVARCWSNETAIALKQTLDNEIPSNIKSYEIYKGGDNKLHINARNGGHTIIAEKQKFFKNKIQAKSTIENKNSQSELQYIETTIYKYLKEIESVPSVPFQDVPEIFKLQRAWDDQLDDDSFKYEDEMDEEKGSTNLLFTQQIKKAEKQML